MRRLAAIALAGLVFATLPALSFAAPAAGTVIGNQATATYNDSGGNARTATSNLVQTTVTQVKSFSLTANGARTAAPGQTVYYPHTITNTGNGTDTYALNAPVSSSFGTGPHTSLAYYIDANGDGLPDNATAITTTGAVPAGGTFRFVVAGTVPASAASGNTATITVSVTDTNPTTTLNTDTTTVASSVIGLTKSFSSTSGASPSGPVTVTLSYINTGTAAATNVQITDPLPSTLTYVAGSGRSSVTGGALLTDQNDGVEQSGTFPPGIDYRSTLGPGATVTAILPSVAAGATGNVTFQVLVNANLGPQAIGNTASYQTASQPISSSNTASFQVLQAASVVANGSNNNSANGVGEPVLIASAPAGSTITFNDYVWNRGNGSDTFDMSIAATSFPPGTTVTLLQQDGVTPLINSGGGPAPDTGPVPGLGQPCAAPFVTDTTVTPNACGYRVVVRVVLPNSAAAASYSATLRATSAFNSALFDDVVDTLGTVSANTADVTNDNAAPPAGSASVADGLGATGAAVVRTNTVTPGAAAVPTRFRVWVTNTGPISYDFGLSAVFAATSVAGVTPPALPAGWSVVFKADASGAASDCSAVGAVITATGPLAAGAAKLACAEVTVPTLASGAALAGNYDFDFIAAATTNSTVTDSVRDRVGVASVRSMTFTGSGALQTFAGGSVSYTHTLTNLGNAPDTASFNAACLSDSRAGWASTAYLDANANGTLEIGTDTPIVCGTSSATLQPGEARAVFIRVSAPAGALPSDPADVTSLTATYSAALTVTDSTSIIAGLAIVTEQQALGSAGCTNSNPAAAAYSAAAIAASPNTAAGSCIAYRVTITNTTATGMTGVALSDLVPAGTKIHYACSGNGTAAPSVTLGSIAGTTPADSGTGTVGAAIGNLAASQSAVLYFCVQVNAATPVGTSISDQASGSGTQSGNTASTSSNTVVAAVGAAAGATSGGTLASNNHVFVNPGQVVLFRHTLTNTGSSTDSFSLTLAEQPAGYKLSSFAIYPDANNDGKPDSAVPVANPIVLNPGESFHFILQAVVPTTVIVGQDAVRISATSLAGAAVVPVLDVMEAQPTVPPDCATAAKFLSRDRGPSPSDALTVTINYFPCDKARSKLLLSDALPAGMHYVAGSGRWSGTGSLALTDAIAGNDRQGTSPRQVAYDFGQTSANTVTAVVYGIAAQANGSLTFQVTIDPGLAKGAVVTNTVIYTYFDSNGFSGYEQFSSASYTVTGKADLTLVGQHVPNANPGTTVAFTNVLTNTGDATDTFDVTLGASTFPAGTQIRLYKSDGVTPLADTDGDGIADTGPLAPGASYDIVVKADLAGTTPQGSYKVSKTARSARVPSRSVTVDDVVDSVGQSCRLALDPDNQALIGYGQHVTYTHYLTNRGNCAETVQAMLNYLGDSKAGWTSSAYIDNTVAGRGSIPGVVDASDTRIVQGWTATLAPGESLRVLVDVFAPSAAAAAKAAKAAKQLADSDITTLVITGVTVGPLVVHDTTLVDSEDIPGQPSNAIRNFTDGSFSTPTPWGVVGRNLYLRADAAACNADPTAVESRQVAITGPGGESELVTAVETGPDTGIFVVAALAVRAPPVVAGDGVLEGSPNDVFDVSVQGCGTRIETVVTLMAAASVVFDSRSNDPVAGANVTLVSASGGHCTASAAALAGNQSATAVTGSDGRFTFTAPGGDYCLAVKPPNGYRFPSAVTYPQLPAGRNLVVTGPTSGGSYGSPFTVGADGNVVVDLPVDVAAQDGLFVQKTASRQTAEIGDLVDYAVTVRNSTGRALDRADVVLTDTLPRGFGFVPNTARRENAPIAATASGAGLSIRIGHLDAGAEALVTYRVRIGPGAQGGDGVNRVQASYAIAGATTFSNIAAAQVQVTGGVFTDQGFVLGKVFADCNANGVQDKGEAGVPGVRLWMEDGTSSTTDGLGKFSFYGVPNRTHIVKVDAATLPPGASMEAISSRNLGDGNSRIIDLKSGEMHRADFAIAGCEAAVMDEVARRGELIARRADELALATTQLTTIAPVVPDVKALPARGEVSATAPGGVPPPALPGATEAATTPVIAPAAIPDAKEEPGAKKEGPVPPATLEALVPDMDNTLGFVGLADGAVLPDAQAAVRVKGTLGSTFVLEVNERVVDERHVAKRSKLESRQVQAWEYLGVDLEPGDNVLAVVQKDSFGNERGRATVKVIAPGPLAKIAIELPRAEPAADGRAEVPIGIALLDERGLPVRARTPVTLDTSMGTWVAPETSLESGVDLMVEGGHATIRLVSPAQPGEARIIAKSGKLREEARLRFMPDLRQMVAAGVIEGIVNIRRLDSRALVAAGAQDSFERDLTRLSRSSSDGRLEAGARAAFFLKGKILGEALLTAAYDSDKDTQQRLFRDIQPDEFYPVYGDSATRGYDAQSTGRLYVRVDQNKSYLLYGDFNTQLETSVRRLSGYSRSLTGLREHYDNGRVQADVFATRDSSVQRIDEIPANGTSGPYALSSAAGLVNSEKVEILTRDRNRPALVIATSPQARFYDYEMEPLTGRIVFKAPVPSVDASLNPISIRVTYEVDQGGPQFWIYGADAQVKVTDRIEVGASFAEDHNPSDPFHLRGGHAVVRLGERTTAVAEFARTERPMTEGNGNAERIQVRHDGERLKAEAFVARTDPTFDNPGAYLSQGRGESGARLSLKIDERTSLKAEALRTEDRLNNNNTRDGVLVGLERTFARGMKAEIALRHAREEAPAIPATPASPGSAGTTPNEVTSVRARITGPVPMVERATAYGEVEVDTQDASRKVVAIGADYTMPNKGRIYARHEFISSLTGPYGLNAQQQQNTSVLGIDTEYMKDARLFSEYRILDAMSGGDAQAAIGLRNLWTLAPGWRMGTTLERVQTLNGKGQEGGATQNDNSAVAVGLEYTGSPVWKGSARLEVRTSTAQDSVLQTLGFASRLTREWTFLARNAYSIQRNKGGASDGTEHVIERMQAGVAFRDADTDRMNGLARFEHKAERDDTQPGIALRTTSEIVSAHGDYKPSRPFMFTAHLAAKWTDQTSNGIATRYRAQLIAGRATWEFAPKWDIGLAVSGLYGEPGSSRQHGLGIEVGYLLATNLWLSAGYNVFGYHDDDLAAGDYTNKGAYVRLRYKFDEAILPTVAEAKK